MISVKQQIFCEAGRLFLSGMDWNSKQVRKKMHQQERERGRGWHPHT